MAEFDFVQTGSHLTIDRKYYNTLDIRGFSQMMKDPSYCYKFYWLEAIVNLILESFFNRFLCVSYVLNVVDGNALNIFRAVKLREHFANL